MCKEYALTMKNIRKEFPGVIALDDVTFSVEKGTIHALCGENGAGKSTLMKVLSGFYPASSFLGEILIDNQRVSFSSIRESEEKGVAVIYQELALVKQMSICENIFLGNEIKKNGIIDWNTAISRTEGVLQEVGLDVKPMTLVSELGIGQQQLVEIAKAISKKAKILVLDEPTAALTESESDALLELMRALKEKGVTCIYISHKLNEVLKIADQITVIRDGKTICTIDKKDTSEDDIIAKMVGRNMDERYPKEEHTPGETVLKVENLTVTADENCRPVLDNISFQVRSGEILGIAGLMGAGRTELATHLFGTFGKRLAGKVEINGKEIVITSPSQAIEYGLSYLSEDRKRYGLVLGMDVKDNACLPNFAMLSKWGRIDPSLKIKYTEKYVKELHIKTPSLEQKAKNLSGGNQQKIVLAKWMMAEPSVLIMDEPTRGIDVGAKYEIYNIMNQLVNKGMSIIMISSELPEILGMSDRILVMCEGRLTAEFTAQEATSEKIMKCATGGAIL